MDKVTMALYGVIAYFVIVMFIGWWASRKVKSLSDYAVAGRRLGPLLVFGTVLATWFGGGTALGGASMAYSFGLRGVIMDPLGAGVAVILFALFFASILRKLRYITIADFFRARYGKTMELASSIVNIVAYMGWLGALLVSFSAVFQVLLGIPFEQGVLLGTIITIIYTFAGGMWSVTLTDFIQMFLLVLGIVLIIPFLLGAVGGWDAINAVVSPDMYSILPGEGMEYLGYVGLFGFMYWISSWVVQGLGSLSCQDLVQRSLSAKDEKTAKWATFAAGIGYWTIGLIPALVAIWGIALIPEIENPDLILPSLAMEVLPPWAFVIFVVGLLAAVMSSSDSAMIIPPTIIAENVLPYFKKDISEKTKVWIARILVPIIALISLAIALYAQTIFFLMNLSWELILMVQGIPFILGIYWKKSNRLGAYASIIVNFAVWIPLIFATLPHTLEVEEGVFEWAIWDSIYIAAIPALIAGTIAFIVVSLLTQKKDPPKQLVSIDGEPLENLK
ncbi:MAG: hypothetical protein DRO10_01560 [Thermoprotei archaeon]|nr:MAG: hypothetical protein DRO10_01560 [Thermoprotei archaeon]